MIGFAWMTKREYGLDPLKREGRRGAPHWISQLRGKKEDRKYILPNFLQS